MTAKLVAVDSDDNEDSTYNVVGKKVDWNSSSPHLLIVTPQGGSDVSNESGLITAEAYSETTGIYNIRPEVASDEVGGTDNVELEHTVISFKRTMWLNEKEFDENLRTEADGTAQAELKVQVYAQNKSSPETEGRSVVWTLRDLNGIGATLVPPDTASEWTDNDDPISSTDASGVAKMYVKATQGGFVEVTATIADVHPSNDTLDATGAITKTHKFTVQFQRTVTESDVTITFVNSKNESLADDTDQVQVKVTATQNDVPIRNAHVEWIKTPNSVGTTVTPGDETTDTEGQAFITYKSSEVGEFTLSARVSSVNLANPSDVTPVTKDLAEPIKFYNYKVGSVLRLKDQRGEPKESNPAIEVTRDDEESFAYYAAALVAVDGNDEVVDDFDVIGKAVDWSSSPDGLIKAHFNESKSNDSGKSIVKVSSATAEQYTLTAKTVKGVQTEVDKTVDFKRTMWLQKHEFISEERTDANGSTTVELKVKVFGNDGINKEGAGRRVRWTIQTDADNWKDISATLQAPLTSSEGETQGALFDDESDNTGQITETDENGIASILVKAEQGGWVDVKAEVIDETSVTPVEETYDGGTGKEKDTTFRVQFKKIITANNVALTFDPNKRKRLADNTEDVTVTVTVTDDAGRKVKYATVVWSKLDLAQTGQPTDEADLQAVTNNDGQASITYTSDTAGNLKLRATVSHINPPTNSGFFSAELEPVVKDMAQPIQFLSFRVETVERVTETAGGGDGEDGAETLEGDSSEEGSGGTDGGETTTEKTEVSHGDDKNYVKLRAEVVAVTSDGVKDNYEVKNKNVHWSFGNDSTPNMNGRFKGEGSSSSETITMPIGSDGWTEEVEVFALNPGNLIVVAGLGNQLGKVDPDTNADRVTAEFEATQWLKKQTVVINGGLNYTQPIEANEGGHIALGVEFYLSKSNTHKAGAGKSVQWTITEIGNTQATLHDTNENNNESGGTTRVTTTFNGGQAWIHLKAPQGGDVKVKAEIVPETDTLDDVSEPQHPAIVIFDNIGFKKTVDDDNSSFELTIKRPDGSSSATRLADGKEYFYGEAVAKDSRNNPIAGATIELTLRKYLDFPMPRTTIYMVDKDGNRISSDAKDFITGSDGVLRIRITAITGSWIRPEARLHHVNTGGAPVVKKCDDSKQPWVEFMDYKIKELSSTNNWTTTAGLGRNNGVDTKVKFTAVRSKHPGAEIDAMPLTGKKTHISKATIVNQSDNLLLEDLHITPDPSSNVAVTNSSREVTYNIRSRRPGTITLKFGTVEHVSLPDWDSKTETQTFTFLSDLKIDQRAQSVGLASMEANAADHENFVDLEVQVQKENGDTAPAGIPVYWDITSENEVIKGTLSAKLPVSAYSESMNDDATTPPPTTPQPVIEFRSRTDAAGKAFVRVRASRAGDVNVKASVALKPLLEELNAPTNQEKQLVAKFKQTPAQANTDLQQPTDRTQSYIVIKDYIEGGDKQTWPRLANGKSPYTYQVKITDVAGEPISDATMRPVITNTDLEITPDQESDDDGKFTADEKGELELTYHSSEKGVFRLNMDVDVKNGTGSENVVNIVNKQLSEFQWVRVQSVSTDADGTGMTNSDILTTVKLEAVTENSDWEALTDLKDFELRHSKVENDSDDNLAVVDLAWINQKSLSNGEIQFNVKSTEPGRITLSFAPTNSGKPSELSNAQEQRFEFADTLVLSTPASPAMMEADGSDAMELSVTVRNQGNGNKTVKQGFKIYWRITDLSEKGNRARLLQSDEVALAAFESQNPSKVTNHTECPALLSGGRHNQQFISTTDEHGMARVKIRAHQGGSANVQISGQPFNGNTYDSSATKNVEFTFKKKAERVDTSESQKPTAALIGFGDKDGHTFRFAVKGSCGRVKGATSTGNHWATGDFTGWLKMTDVEKTSPTADDNGYIFRRFQSARTGQLAVYARAIGVNDSTEVENNSTSWSEYVEFQEWQMTTEGYSPTVTVARGDVRPVTLTMRTVSQLGYPTIGAKFKSANAWSSNLSAATVSAANGSWFTNAQGKVTFNINVQPNTSSGTVRISFEARDRASGVGPTGQQHSITVTIL